MSWWCKSYIGDIKKDQIAQSCFENGRQWGYQQGFDDGKRAATEPKKPREWTIELHPDCSTIIRSWTSNEGLFLTYTGKEPNRLRIIKVREVLE